MIAKNRGAPAGAVRDVAHCLAVAVSTGAAVLFFFSPCFTNWQGLKYPELQPTTPEFERARFALAQLDDPAAPIPHPVHYGIKWRLLFPVLCHLARVPAGIYLALPHMGCVLCLGLVAWLSHKRLQDWSQAWLVTAIFAALPWFFVSTGWLAYFDSWLVLGMLLYTFVPARAVSLSACAFTPWIDERFIFALPVLMATKAALAPADERRSRWQGILIPCVVGGIYVFLRAYEWLSGDAEAVRHINFHLQEARHVGFGTYIEGLWSGFRVAWLVIGLALVSVWMTCGRSMGSLLAAVTAITTVVSLLIVADMSRTLMVLASLALVGMWYLAERTGARARLALGALLAANLLLPASHVVWSRTFPVRSLPTEIAYYRTPPDWIYAPEHFRRGNTLLSAGRAKEAREEFSEAIRLEGRWTAPHVQRAVASLRLGDIESSRQDLEAVLQADPECYDALLLRALLPGAGRDVKATMADLRRALESAPLSWPPRQQVEGMLEQMQKSLQ